MSTSGIVGDPLYAWVGLIIGVAISLLWILVVARRTGPLTPDFWSVFVPYAAVVAIALLIILTILAFPFQIWYVVLISVCALMGSVFAELKDTWQKDNDRFNIGRVVFRTAQWATLAVAAYIIANTLGNTD